MRGDGAGVALLAIEDRIGVVVHSPVMRPCVIGVLGVNGDAGTVRLSSGVVRPWKEDLPARSVSDSTGCYLTALHTMNELSDFVRQSISNVAKLSDSLLKL